MTIASSLAEPDGAGDVHGDKPSFDASKMEPASPAACWMYNWARWSDEAKLLREFGPPMSKKNMRRPSSDWLSRDMVRSRL